MAGWRGERRGGRLVIPLTVGDDGVIIFGEKAKVIVYRGTFNLPQIKTNDVASFFYNSLGKQQSIYVNGKQIAANILKTDKGNTYFLDAALLHKGNNTRSEERR